jgi:hypothetical protein
MKMNNNNNNNVKVSISFDHDIVTKAQQTLYRPGQALGVSES